MEYVPSLGLFATGNTVELATAMQTFHFLVYIPLFALQPTDVTLMKNDLQPINYTWFYSNDTKTDKSVTTLFTIYQDIIKS